MEKKKAIEKEEKSVKKTSAKTVATEKEKAVKKVVKKEPEKKTVAKKEVAEEKKETVKKKKTIAPKRGTVALAERKIPVRKSKSKTTYYTLILLYAFVLIFSNTLAPIPFEFLGHEVLLSVFIYPFTFLVANRITREFGIKGSIQAMGMAVVSQVIIFGAQWGLFQLFDICPDVSLNFVVASIAAFIVSQVANILFYNELLITKKTTYGYIFFCFVFTILLDNAIFLTVTNAFNSTASTINMLTMNNALRILMCCVATAVNINLE